MTWALWGQVLCPRNFALYRLGVRGTFEDLEMLRLSFPVTDYYRDHILDGQTLKRGGGWWTAILLVSDPRTGKPFVALYRWQSTPNGWKTRKRFSFKKAEEINKAIEILSNYAARLT